MEKVITITVSEIVQAMVGYEAAVSDLHNRLKGTDWDDKFRVVMAFERWTNRQGDDLTWQEAYRKARDYIEMHGMPPWDCE